MLILMFILGLATGLLLTVLALVGILKRHGVAIDNLADERQPHEVVQHRIADKQKAIPIDINDLDPKGE